MGGFQKQRVYEQVVELLLQRMHAGDWLEKLPSERWLSDDLGVSRDQVHSAIVQLRRRGVIKLEGKKNLIRIETVPANQLTTVVVVTPTSLQSASHGFLYCLDQLRNRLTKDGVTVQVEALAVLSPKSPIKSLERVMANYSQAVWVLHRASSVVQQWFEASGQPVVVLGTAADSVSLNCIDLDHAAAARHAVGCIQRAGHSLENVLMLRPTNDLEGVAKMECGYREAIASAGVFPLVLRYREGEALGQKISQWLDKGVHLEALVVTSYKAASFISGWLASKHALVVGRDLSLICLSDGPSLELQYPAVAYYAMHGSGLSSKAVQLVQQKLKGIKSTKQRAITVMPEFVAGGSICKSR